MHKILARWAGVFGLALAWAEPSYAAVDSYRFLHVTIDTPWTIFIFLLFIVLAPFVLMSVLVWRYTERRIKSKKQQPEQAEDGQ
jgi:membrane protein implicated in regulation of membrane protease activity